MNLLGSLLRMMRVKEHKHSTQINSHNFVSIIVKIPYLITETFNCERIKEQSLGSKRDQYQQHVNYFDYMEL
jgi:hypothetical protein